MVVPAKDPKKATEAFKDGMEDRDEDGSSDNDDGSLFSRISNIPGLANAAAAGAGGKVCVSTYVLHFVLREENSQGK